MTPFELELLRTVWPYVWTAILGAGTWFLRAQNARLEAISKTLGEFGAELARVEKQMLADRAEHQHRIDRVIGEFGAELARVEKQMLADRAEHQHRIDRVIGDADARISRIEAVCETQHGQALNRRSGDSRPINWAHDSDVAGNIGK